MKIACRIVVATLGIAILAPEAQAAAGGGIVHSMMILAMQLGVILFAAKLGGALFEKVLRLPGVLGELCAGMVIGPFALGSIELPLIHGPLFPYPPALPHGIDTPWPVSAELYGIATLASIVLLFLIGLETDLKMFFRFFVPGTVVGIGGVVGSFILGDVITVAFAESLFEEPLGQSFFEAFMDPRALFMGTISTATSVGITARVLSEKRKLDSPEGTTILAGAVIDDVLGIIVLAIVVGISDAAKAGGGGPPAWGDIGVTAAKAIGFWVVATGVGLAASPWIARFLRWVPSPGATIALGLGCALLLAGLAESFKLAMIIGAYIMGLALSREEVSHELERDLSPVYHSLVPIFFAVMGMLVDFGKMWTFLAFGLIYTVIAILAKVIVAGLPVLAVGFNFRGAARVGFGMLPRGEVALIVAAVGLGNEVIDAGLFGVAILMTVVTTILAPPILVALFRSKESGLRTEEERPGRPPLERLFSIPDLDHATRQVVIEALTAAFEAEGYTVRRVSVEEEVYQISREPVYAEMDADADAVHLHTQPHHQAEVRPVIGGALDGVKRRVEGLRVREEMTGGGEKKDPGPRG